MTDGPTIALCFPTCNNLPILRSTLIHNMRWADQICILDLGSTDGTREFLKAVLRPQDIYTFDSLNIIPEFGFAVARGQIASRAGTDWIWHGASNCCLDWECAEKIHGILDKCKSDVIAHQTIHVEDQSDCIEHAVQRSGQRSEWHRQIHRRGVGIEMKGYIHEELYRGEQNMWKVADAYIDLRQYHFEGRGNDELRRTRAAWMLMRAMKEPELQRHTNRYWYDQWVPQHLGELQQMANKYEVGGVGR